ncbi:MAG: efflux RND transporter periplasmic adaptor subunit [Alphaproteobacteria bacterium]
MPEDDKGQIDAIETRSGFRRYGIPGLIGALIVAAIFAGTATLHLRAAVDPGAASPALPVSVMTATKTDGYEVRTRYAGRLEADRETRVAFERGGLITGVLVDEGDTVQEGQVIARLDTQPLLAQRDRLRAQRAQVAADLELSRLTEDRQAFLVEKGHVSRQRFDEARLQTKALNARLAEVDANLRAIAIDIDKSVVRAQFAGTVSQRLVDEGAVVAAGTPVVDLLETGAPKARIGLSPDIAATLTPGTPYDLKVGNRSLNATLESLRPDISNESRTVHAVFDLPGTNGLPLGEVVHLEIGRIVEAKGFWLPVTALSEGRKGLWSVYVAGGQPGESTVEREAVEVIHFDADRVFVRGTLRDGARVITAGLDRIIPGQRITTTEIGG